MSAPIASGPRNLLALDNETVEQALAGGCDYHTLDNVINWGARTPSGRWRSSCLLRDRDDVDERIAVRYFAIWRRGVSRIAPAERSDDYCGPGFQ